MTERQPLVLESRLTEADWAALQRAWGERVRLRVGRLRLLTAVAAPLVAAAVLVHRLDAGRGAAAFAVGVCAMLVTFVWTTRLFRRWSRPEANGLVLGDVRIELSGEGIRTGRRVAQALLQWSAVREITSSRTHVFLWVDAVSAQILPLRDLPEGETHETLVARVHEYTGPLPLSYVRSAGEHVLAAVEAQADGERPRVAFLAHVARRLTGRIPTPDAAGSSDAVILTCALVALGVWLAADRLAAGSGAEWYGGGVVGLVWYAAFVPTLAYVLGRASLATVPFRLLLAAFVGALPLGLAAGLAIHRGLPPLARPPAYALLALLALVHVRRQLRAASGGPLRLVLVAGVLLTLAFAWGTRQTWVYPHLWYANDEEEEEERSGAWAQGEQLLFEQADRIDAAARRLVAGRPHRLDVFFVGFAGVGEQKVFAEELKLAERVIGQRYGSTGRSLLLINDRRDRESLPLATVPGLRRALDRVGARMDPAEDVLFLFLTSHGSEAPALSVSNGAWPLRELDGPALRQALDASGIRWRVVVISACHSGAFIEPLADPSTIVLTSAAKDRTSFGCSDDRDVTDFGAAFVRDALPGAASLQAAFELAKQAIAERERREKLTASSPQAYFGSAISEHWKRVEAERR